MADQDDRPARPRCERRRCDTPPRAQLRRGVPDDQFEWLAKDSAGIVDIVDGQLKARKQMLAGFDPAGPTQRNECADSEGCFVGSTGFRYRL